MRVAEFWISKDLQPFFEKIKNKVTCFKICWDFGAGFFRLG